MSGSDVEVAIIGAGAAGVAAGRRLADAGVDIRIIEARSRIGGRGFTAVDPVAGPLDLGCGWLHSGDRNPWTEIAERQGRAVDRAPAPWQRPPLEVSFPATERAAFIAADERFYDRLSDAVAAGAPDRAAAAYLEPGCRWNELMNAISTYVSGAELERVSARDLAAYADTGVNWRVRDGFGAVIAAHGEGLPVTLDCPVGLIDHSGREIRIETARGAIRARQVIITVPSALIAGGAVRFSPALPDKQAAAAGLPLGLADKLYFTLDRAEAFEPDSRASGRTDRAETAAYHFRPLGRPLVEAYFGGSCAAGLERAGPSAFVDFAQAELAGLFGADFSKRLRPLPMHLWAADPFARGSYSFASPGRAGDRAILAAPVDHRLYFAGEACSSQDFSTAHGAMLTGLAAANAVLSTIKSPTVG